MICKLLAVFSKGRPGLSVFLGVVVLPGIFVCFASGNDKVSGYTFSDFYNALELYEDERCLETGEAIFENLRTKHGENSGFIALKSRFQAAEFLVKRMINELKRATGRQLFAKSGQVFGYGEIHTSKQALMVAPAKSFHEDSLGLFRNPVKIKDLEDAEKRFLSSYYDFRLQRLTEVVARAGQALAIAEPDFEGTYNYTLVLPLLHSSEEHPVWIAVLPRWMRRSGQLRSLSDSSLLHYGLSFQAMVLGRAAAKMDGEEFSKVDFYKSAAKKAGVWNAHIASDCLRRAIGITPAEQVDDIVGLHFDILQLWLDSSNFVLAAGQSRTIYETFPEHGRAGKAIWLYYYSLSRAGKSEEILMNIDGAISDKRAEAYKSKLMYIKWWALRRGGGKLGMIAGLEYKLLKRYGNNPIVAPILLSRATDSLAKQDYGQVYNILNRLKEKFPSAEATKQAEKMLKKLKNADAIK